MPPPPAKRLVRSREERMIAGVCGGLARYWNTDPALLRILTVVLTIVTGGALLVGYIIAWIAIREDSGPAGTWPSPGATLPPSGMPVTAEPPLGYAQGGNPPYYGDTDYAPVPQPPKEPKERSYLGWLILSGVAMVLGVIGMIGLASPLNVSVWGAAGGVALTLIGLGLIAGTWYGRARWLVILAVPLTFITFATVSANNWVQNEDHWGLWQEPSGGLIIGDRTWVVTPAMAEAADEPLVMRLSAGEAVLDLTQLTAGATGTQGSDDVRAGDPVRIQAGVGLGELRVLIPHDMQLNLDASVRAGDMRLPGAPSVSGTNLSQTRVIGPVSAEAGYKVELDAAIGAGSLTVTSGQSSPATSDTLSSTNVRQTLEVSR